MTQKDNHYFSHTYKINSFLVNGQGKLGLYALLNILQDCSWLHAKELGHGSVVVENKKLLWVLTRQKLQMKHWPVWGEEIEVHTWLRPIESIFGNRDFEIFYQGKSIGLATTSWLLLDADSRKPFKDIAKIKIPILKNVDLKIEAQKIILKDNAQKVQSFKVRNSDMDMNQHVNNTRYAQWILDSIPYEKHFQHKLEAYQVNFIAETHTGEEISIYYIKEEDNKISQFYGLREEDQKIVFSAELTVD